jgi:hypothetical protein
MAGMTTLRAHFDGRVLIPEGPVDLPQGKSLEIVVREAEAPRPAGIRSNPVSGLAEFDVPADAPAISAEDVRRAIEEE